MTDVAAAAAAVLAEAEVAARDRRVLLLAPTNRDAVTTEQLFANAGIEVTACTTFDDLLEELKRGSAVVIVSEEAVSSSHNAQLRAVLQEQPPWSDVPILVLTRPGADSAASGDAVRTLGNVTLLERPLRINTLLSAVRTALRARERQYQIRGYLAERAHAEESLRIADQRKDEFLATLGHELRNPLAPLLTGLQLLRLARIQDSNALRVVTMMERQIQHLVRLVDDLLEVSRITRGVIDVQREPLDLVATVRAAVESCRPLLEAERHELTLDLPGEPLVIAGDAVRLGQVFGNLLTNAAKYTKSGGHVWVTVERREGHAVVAVRDNGLGIPLEHLNSVFDMFMQLDRSNRSNRRVQGGLGIGLTLVRSLVAMHGGRVEAHSDGDGAGSEFVVELPLLAQDLAPLEEQEAPPEFPGRRILVVDDNQDAGESLGTLLGALGATVVVVDGGRAALAALDRFRPDTVLLDLGMPEMDGYEVARRIRSSEQHRQVLLVALTGWGQDQDQRQSQAAGFDHHLVKPPDLGKLRDVLLESSDA